jgi:polyphosphate kinase 2 (PPK2 family)
MWRFWNLLPAAGDIVILDHSWYRRLLHERLEDPDDEDSWREAFDDIRDFERQLTDSGSVLVKFWLHISKSEQKDRFETLESNPAMSWRVGKQEWRQNKKYDQWLAAVEEVLARTATANAPWTLVEATQERYVRVKVLETIAAAIQQELNRRAAAPPPERKPMPEPADWPPPHKTILDRVDLSLSLSREEYEDELDKLQ